MIVWISSTSGTAYRWRKEPSFVGRCSFNRRWLLSLEESPSASGIQPSLSLSLLVSFLILATVCCDNGFIIIYLFTMGWQFPSKAESEVMVLKGSA